MNTLSALRLLILLPTLVGLGACQPPEYSSSPPQPRPWYHTLRPGVTRPEIERLSGFVLPTGEKTTVEAGAVGRFEFEFRGDGLHRAMLYDSAMGGGAQLYATFGDPAAVDLAARRAFLKAGRFMEIPRFKGAVIRTSKYDGSCYEVDGQFIIVEPILGFGSGHFANKAARVLLVDAAGAEKTLFRAIDHWSDLRPPNVSRSAVGQREATLRRLGPDAMNRRIGDVLGPEDSQMGSGIDYRVYYLPSALAIIGVGSRENVPMPMGGGRPDFIRGIRISTPGAGREMSFEEWLGANRAAR